jgi:serine/threonine protein kinase
VTPERWHKVKSLFDQALDRDPQERRAFLADAAGEDEKLRREVESLLDALESGSHEDLRIAIEGVRITPTDSGTRTGDTQRLLVRLCTRCNSRYGLLERICPADGEVLVEDPEALVGSTLDGLYHIERLLGRGAMGTVYLARHALMRDLVAIKVLPYDLSSNPDYLKRFFREGRAARAINHANAVHVFELRTTADGIAYMVQEFIDGRTLRREMAQRGPMTVADALEVARPIASALDEAHAHGVVHRDLKPENVMLGTVGGKPVVKLMDLGIAKFQHLPDGAEGEPTALTIAGQIMGTPYYMPPEQWGELARDGRGDVDARADVYSLAVVLYELVAGRRPFSGRSLREIRRAHLSQAVPRLDETVPGIPPGVGEALARGMSKDRSDRQETCGRLIAEVEHAPGALTCEARGRSEVDTEAATETLNSTSRQPSETTNPHEHTFPVETQLAPETIHAQGPSPPRPSLVARAAAGVLVAAMIAVSAYLLLRDGDTPSAPVPAPNPVAEQSTRSLAYTVTVQKYRGGTKYKDPLDVTGGFPFTVEDKIWITVVADESGYLYAIAEASRPDPSTGEPIFRVLFPDPTVNDGSPRVAAGARVRIPPEGVPPIDFDDTRGTEKLWIVSSADPITALDGAAGLLNARDLGRISDPARVAALRELFKPHHTGGTDDSKRTIVRSHGPVLVALRELEHY